jgi:hypothetical protein
MYSELSGMWHFSDVASLLYLEEVRVEEPPAGFDSM